MRVTDTLRGQGISARMDRLGISARELADRLGMDRQSVTRAREGNARPATYGAIESELDRIEAEVLGERATEDTVASTIRLPDGTIVTFQGPAEGVAEAAARFVARHRGEVKPSD